MWDGWMSFGGTEIINAPRVMAYVKGQNPNVVVADPCSGACQCDDLPSMLGDKAYTSPLVDEAPWTDFDRPESYNFYGVYPLDVRGIDDDTITTTNLDSLGDGGWITNMRRGMKEIFVEAALISADDEADHYGAAWLRSVLEGSCESGDCLPTDKLCFLTACADLSDGERSRSVQVDIDPDLATRYLTRLDNRLFLFDHPNSFVKFESPDVCDGADWELQCNGEAGVTLRFWINDTDYEDHTFDNENEVVTVHTDDTILKVTVADDGGAAWPLTLQAWRVRAYGFVESTLDECLADYQRELRRVARTEGPITTRVERLSDGMVVRTVRWVMHSERPHSYGPPRLVTNITDIEAGGDATIDPIRPYRVFRLSENIGECPDARPTRYIYDPDMPTAPPKPPPSLRLVREPRTKPARRPYAIRIPSSELAAWTGSVPIIEIRAADEPLRDIKVRFFTLPFDDALPGDVDECAACGSFWIDYIPRGYLFTLDGADERAYITKFRYPADHLLASGDGTGVISWPVLDCGTSYLVVVDTRDQKVESISMELAVRE